MAPRNNPDVDELLSKLTLNEKISLLSAVDWWRTPIIEREGVFVPHLKTTDGPNGARGESYVSGIKAACFPCGTSLGSTFDVDLARQVGVEIAKEAKTKTANILLGPTLNMIRSPLGGRNYETYSEDPVVLGLLAAAFSATPKHFVANDAENRRRFLSCEVDEQTLRELYLLPFQYVMKLAAPKCFMTSYNKVNGTYVGEDRRLCTDVLRGEWGFKGLVMSDWTGTYSTAEAINAGLDLEMPGPTKWRGEKLQNAVKEGLVTEDTINTSARRVLALASALGRWESPDEPPEVALDNPERDAFIAAGGADGMVLLKNQNNLLPLPDRSSVAMIGQFASVASLGGGGSARVDAIRTISPIEGMQSLGHTTNHAQGVPVFGALPHAPLDVVFPCGSDEHSDTPVKLEWFNSSIIGQNPAYTEHSLLPEYMIKERWPDSLARGYSVRMTYDIKPSTTGRHHFSIITTGVAKCFIDNELLFTREQEKDMIAESFYFFKSKIERRFDFEMEAGRRYAIRVEIWGTEKEVLHAPPLNGHLFQGTSLRFHEHIDIPGRIEHACEAARRSDYAIVCVGTTNEIESEGFDRETMSYLSGEYDMIKAVTEANPKTIVVSFSGSPMDMSPFIDSVPAVIQAWFPGQECGHSVARILSGVVNPSGRLPLSWPRRLEDNPSHGNFPVDKNDIIRYQEGLDVGYRWYDRRESPEPLFPFGFGLSYTTFSISNVNISGSSSLKSPDNTVKVICKVSNTGRRAGKVVVQFYIQYPNITIGRRRPVKELKAFVKVHLEEGETKDVSVLLDKYAVSFYDADAKCWRAIGGDYVVHVGQSAVDVGGETKISIAKEGFTWNGL
ncbi:hypothetical protein CEP51_001062 [Fusarium floridanum]|uniref:beta-glucosidase n=1 Tax=Fusarium floridanum TaxID=1325733 RepID=A0A428SIZ0_9HYPO|nr:hypothetical protein CEP51_001062 [Fusarium floridanum]